MDATIFNENEIKTILVNVVKELYPFYREIKPWVAIYSKDKFLNLDNEYVSLTVNYDNFGKIFIKDGKLVARGGFRAGVGVQNDVDSIEQGIRTLVKSYFNIRQQQPGGSRRPQFCNNIATEKQVKQAIKQVLDSEYMNKMVTFDKGWKFKVKSYNIRTRSRFIPKDERDDYGCDVDANKFFIIEFNNAKDEMDATDAAAICLTLNPAGQIGTTGIPYDYEIESVTSDLDLDIYEKVLAIINNK